MEIYPDFPADTIQFAKSYLDDKSIPNVLSNTVQLVVNSTLAPPGVKEILQACALTRLIHPDHEQSIVDLSSHLQKLKPEEIEQQYFGIKKYPLFHALKKIAKEADEKANRDILEHFMELAKSEPERSQFRRPSYYQHITALRDVTLIMTKLGLFEKMGALRSASARKLLRTELEENSASVYVKKFDEKFVFFSRRCAGTTRCGSAEYRDPSNRRKGKIALPDDLDEPGDSYSLINIDCSEDAILYQPQKELTHHNDRVYEHKSITNAFGRTNIRNRADMAACSLITYAGYLRFAQSSDPHVFSLIWLAAVTGINLKRDIIDTDRTKKPTGSGHIYLERTHIRYQIYRRPIKDQDGIWESAGWMLLPIPFKIAEALKGMCKADNQKLVYVDADALATKYSKHSPGLTPTLQRLRVSARTLFAPLAFRELEFAAVQGKIPPALKAVSHYYPIRLHEIQRKFYKAYVQISSDLSVFEDFPLAKFMPNKNPHLFCKANGDRRLVQHLFSSLSDDIRALNTDLRQSRVIELNTLAQYSNLIEAIKYICQQFGLGLRPIGEKARLWLGKSGAISVDKSSRLFQERSFSITSDAYNHSIELALNARKLVEESAEMCGLKYEEETGIGDLAGIIQFKSELLTRKKMTGGEFIEFIQKIYPGIKIKRTNWIRRTFAEEVYGKLPQWLIDEQMSHRRVGREPLALHSTAGAKWLEPVKVILNSIHTSLEPLTQITQLNLARKIIRPSQ